MEQFVRSPHLPLGKVTLVAVSARYPELVQKLKDLGIRCIEVPPCLDLAAPVWDHPDMLLYHFGGERVLVYPYHEKFIKQFSLEGFQIEYPEFPLQPEYPFDIKMNCLRLGDTLIGNLRYTDKKILSDDPSVSRIVVKQGYTKCSCAVVDDRSVITTDSGIANQLTAQGFDVLFIQESSIRLDGYDCGFIGGCCGKISPNHLCFTGSLKYLSQKDGILSFLEKKGVSPIYLTENPLVDIGSIIPLKEDLCIPFNL
jgi:hypothetical protein